MDAYNAEVDRRAGKQHVGLIAQDAYRIAKLMTPLSAIPGVVDGDQIQAALVLLVKDLIKENKQQRTAILSLQAQVDSLQANFEARLQALEAP